MKNSYSTSTSGGILYSSEFIQVNLAADAKGDEENGFQPKAACVSCRKLHRRCSKEFPKCSECVTHHRKCIYMDTKTKERNLASSSSTDRTTSRDSRGNNQNNNNSKRSMRRAASTIEEPQIAITEGLIKKSIKRQTFNVYMDLVCMGLPFITPQNFENMLFSENILNQNTNATSIKALFLSIQSLCDQRFGRRDAAIAAFNEAKSELHQVFEDYDNYLNICTYNNLAYFSGAEGEDQMSQWFMSPVEYYLSKYSELNFNSHNELIGLAFENLNKGSGITKLFYFDNRYKWTSLTFGDYIGIPFKLSTGKRLPPELKQLVDRDLNENTAQAESAVLQCILQFMKQHHQKLVHSPGFLNLSRIVDVSSFTKTRIESLRVLYSKANSQEKRELFFKEMLNLANTTTELSKDDLFPYILPTNIFGFALAAEIHLEALSNFSHLVSVSEILGHLKQDFLALTVLARKYGRVQKVYGYIYDEIQSVLLNNGVPAEELLNLISNNSFKTPSTPKLYPPITVNNQTHTISPTNNSTDQVITSENSSPTSENVSKKKDFPSAAFLNNTLRNFKKTISNQEICTITPRSSTTSDSPINEEEISCLKNQTLSILQQTFSK
ncbi:predicted protein [Naegleria gruberi]|uniref:Predicted protein n=1 Tax=Naegleria gruberi TaxID=5762 RepID=D2VJM0_NAEGR|nr:uncharacterized protein NAEGRDRAFT_50084 [Naegleria gruberi]EFC42974.1 predicted protein [Naegleria gruberi]|eukprot:XP_002675718.1 predicted protein [Naegleria gruberi strain NEG-M]